MTEPAGVGLMLLISRFFITLDKAEALTGKHTIFGTVVGDTYFNVVKIGESEIQPGTDRPIYPVVVKSIEVDDNPFSDIKPRITAAERREQDKARRQARRDAATRSRKKDGVKNKSLMSFGDEPEAIEPSTSETGPKLTSAHDALANDPTLRSESQETRGLPAIMPEGFGEPLAAAKSDSLKRKADVMSKPALEKDLAPWASGGFATRVEGASSNKASETYRPSNGKAGAGPSQSERVKAEIAKVQADLMRFTKRGSDEPEDLNGGASATKKPKHDGAALLAAERAKYARGGRSIGKKEEISKGKRREVDETDVMDVLEGFRGKLRAAIAQGPDENDGTDEARPSQGIDGYNGEIMEEDDVDDSGWMSHTLKFRKDATLDKHTIDEYEVVDPRAQGMTLEEAKRQSRPAGSRPSASGAQSSRPGDRRRDGQRQYAHDYDSERHTRHDRRRGGDDDRRRDAPKDREVARNRR